MSAQHFVLSMVVSLLALAPLPTLNDPQQTPATPLLSSASEPAQFLAVFQPFNRDWCDFDGACGSSGGGSSSVCSTAPTACRNLCSGIGCTGSTVVNCNGQTFGCQCSNCGH